MLADISPMDRSAATRQVPPNLLRCYPGACFCSGALTSRRRCGRPASGVVAVHLFGDTLAFNWSPVLTLLLLSAHVLFVPSTLFRAPLLILRAGLGRRRLLTEHRHQARIIRQSGVARDAFES
jgi:hypothetical protein